MMMKLQLNIPISGIDLQSLLIDLHSLVKTRSLYKCNDFIVPARCISLTLFLKLDFPYQLNNSTPILSFCYLLTVF